MKKSILVLAALLTFTASVFAAEAVNADEPNNVHITAKLGSQIYESKVLSNASLSPTKTLNLNLVCGEVGLFTSDEDGFADMISYSGLGIAAGSTNANSVSWTRNNITYTGASNSFVMDVFLKETAGLQFNTGFINFGCLSGIKVGGRFINLPGQVNGTKMVDFHSNSFYFATPIDPYVSLSFAHLLKFSVGADFDLSLFRAAWSYDTNTSGTTVQDTIHVDFPNIFIGSMNDIPFTLSLIGTILL